MSGVHIMVDLETMGSTPGCAIASIGAVVFDPLQPVTGATFYRLVDLATCKSAGLTFDPDTIVWWLKQSAEARSELTGGGGVHIGQALQDFGQWWREQDGRFIWGHGANFDEPVLGAAYRALHISPPWDFWNARCTRTVYDLADVKPDRAAGTHHKAVDDAVAQALAVSAAYRKLGMAKAALP